VARTRAQRSGAATEFLSFAQELMEVAEECSIAGRWRAAGLNAIHASIAASDAVCVARLGESSSAEAHGEAAELLSRSGAPGAAAKAVQFSAVIAKKGVFAYEARPPERADAEVLIKRARRLVDWAGEVVRERPRRI